MPIMLFVTICTDIPLHASTDPMGLIYGLQAH